MIVAVVLISSRGGGGSPEAKVDPEVPTFEVQDSVVSMATGAGALWLAGPYGVGRFDLATSTVTQSLKIGTDGNTRRVAFGAGLVWVTDTEAKTWRASTRRRTRWRVRHPRRRPAGRALRRRRHLGDAA